MRRLAALALVPALAVCGCSAGTEAQSAGTPPPGDPSLLVPYGEEIPSSAGVDSEIAADASGSVGGSGTSGGSPARAAAPGAVLPDSAPAPAPAGPLRAGSVDDNARFADYLDFRARSSVPADELDISERHVVTVQDSAGLPVLGATVALVSGDTELQSARTHAGGRALLFPLVTDEPDAEAYDVVVFLGDAVARMRIDDREVRTHEVTLDAEPVEGPVRLDLHFLLDTTGSMGDEIDRLQSTLDDVAAQIEALPAEPVVRYGLTLYRDAGDAYLSRTGDFTDLATFRAELATVRAAGGGDEPEALDEALHAAVNGPAWDPRAVQIAFLVADAPPHLGDAGRSYADDVQVAVAKGIEVVPLASSGTSDAGEYVFRQLAQYSQGTFFFVTYGADGRSPGDLTDLDVSGYETGSLDELIVQHVASRLGALEGRGAGQ